MRSCAIECHSLRDHGQRSFVYHKCWKVWRKERWGSTDDIGRRGERPIWAEGRGRSRRWAEGGLPVGERFQRYEWHPSTGGKTVWPPSVRRPRHALWHHDSRAPENCNVRLFPIPGSACVLRVVSSCSRYAIWG